jgi:hypothetical protein
MRSVEEHPKSVLARHYTDFSPVKIREAYNGANIKVGSISSL